MCHENVVELHAREKCDFEARSWSLSPGDCNNEWCLGTNRTNKGQYLIVFQSFSHMFHPLSRMDQDVVETKFLRDPWKGRRSQGAAPFLSHHSRPGVQEDKESSSSSAEMFCALEANGLNEDQPQQDSWATN